MNSIFGLKRRSRTRAKQDITSPSKAKPLHILPEVTEEDEGRASTSSTTSSSSRTQRTTSPKSHIRDSVIIVGHPPKDVAERKRDSRRVVLTGAEGLTFEDFFPAANAHLQPAPSPSIPKSTCEQSELRFSGLGVDMSFPSPPRKQRRDKSPTPSIASSTTTNDSNSTTASTVTPPTSEDEARPKSNLARAPAFKSQRGPRAKPEVVPEVSKQRPPRIIVPDPEEDVDNSDVEDATWFAQDISDTVTLQSPYPPSFPSTPVTASLSTCDLRARPDSIPPPPRRPNAALHSRHSKPLPIVPRLSIKTVSHGPSAQLDPTFHSTKARRALPIRPPPPPPIRIEDCSTPTMEERTEELLALLANAALANAALTTGFLGTGLLPEQDDTLPTPVTPSSIFAICTPSALRPPPRMSIPADIFDLTDDMPRTPVPNNDDEFDLPINETNNDLPSTPQTINICSRASLNSELFTPFSPFDFDLDEGVENGVMAPAIPESPLVGMFDSTDSVTPSPSSLYFPQSSTTSPLNISRPQRTLRSRWSTSTLSSTYNQPQSASSWMLRFHIGSSNQAAKKSGSKAKISDSKQSKVSSSSPKWVKELDPELERKASRGSLESDSGESISSNGLRRKPIPLEIFLR
ncbi:hypothetical protein NLI96_g11151 [Meripilus lineatus]|uniref:Uncharacterized protein n=1 Tax=Meripilus lineatus TaxID=2056292 RepID=A0AAD5YDJ2_9APHY|nr:hypothetical protein NLI96_g11151 [Physisporinus lineatus]